jgi:hypothetical protein
MKKMILLFAVSILMSGCSVSAQTQGIQASEGTTAQSESKVQESKIEKLVIQRGKDIFTFDYPKKDLAIISDAQDLYTRAYKGHLEAEELGIKTAKDFGFIQDSLGMAMTSKNEYTYLRIIQPVFIPEVGMNVIPRKDIILYNDPAFPNDAFVAIQNPEKLDEWSVVKMPEFGIWLKKEIDLFLRTNTGL